jgi:hypothetical protein
MNFTNKEPFYWAVENGIGIRRDGYSAYGECFGGEVLWGVNRVPLALEMPNSYTWQKHNLGFDAERLLRSPELNRASYYPLGASGQDARVMLRELKDAIDQVTNKIGYHFSLMEAEFSGSLGKGTEGIISMRWLNDGVAKIFIDSHLAVALLDQDDNVVDVCWLDGIDPKEWICSMDMVTEDKTNHVSDTFSFSKFDNKNKLAIGLFTDKSKESPDIKIGNKGRTSDGWYVIYDENEPLEPIRNLAAFKNVSASSQLDGFEPSYATDMASTYWSSGNGTEEWLMIDLGKVQSISSLEIDWGINYASSFKVLASKNGDTGFWEVFSTDSNNGEKQTYEFAPADARFVKIVCTESGRKPFSCDTIIPVPGENLLTNPSFEDGLYFWRDYRSKNVELYDGSYKTDGNHSLRFNSEREINSISQSLTQVFELTGPGEYEVSFDVYPTDADILAGIEIGVKGSKDDQMDVQWWDAKTKYYHVTETLKKDEWTNVTWKGEVSWEGLIDMAYLKLGVYDGNNTDVFVDNVRLIKLSEINGEREERYIPQEGSYTIKNISIR